MKLLKKISKIFIFILVPIIVISLYFLMPSLKETSQLKTNNTLNKMTKLTTEDDIDDFVNNNSNINIKLKYTYNDDKKKGIVISQSIKVGEDLSKYKELEILISLGKFDPDKLSSSAINELGRIPIMMYHGIVDMKSDDTKYTGGNVDKDGYTRTTEAFRADLEFYYQNNYRMIRLEDYVEGNIDTEYGKSPLVLTFDDGNENNIKITGLDAEGNIEIDPNSAVGILEEFKQKYPDFNVTATFFVNDTLFNQPTYDEEIIKWLVNNGYDVGNHTRGHIDIKDETYETVSSSIGYVYNQLENIIPDKYVKIVALPFGSPYKKDHENFSAILSSSYEDKTYETVAALRVGWDAEESPYSKSFDKTFLKRCRAYDNNGQEFDISMVFSNLEKNKYISDGSRDTVVFSCQNQNKLGEITTKEVKCY